MKFTTNLVSFENDFLDVIKLYMPDFCEDNGEGEISLTSKTEGNKIISQCKIILNNRCVISDRNDKLNYKNDLEEKKLIKRFSKLCIYECLADFFKKEMPWGSLTGIRPTKIGYELKENGVPNYLIKDALNKYYKVSEPKAKLVSEIITNQNCIIKNDKLIDLYVHIPFCPSRCTYCSFPSAEYCAVESKIPNFVDCLVKEIKQAKEIINTKNYVVRSIYVGGGTPTVLNDELFEMVLSELSYPVKEFTVECGRADTITEKKLSIMQKYGVTRVCLNPQTFNDKTLKLIGRNHTVKDVFNAYKLMLGFDFDVNMDLIAGLPEEKFANFKKSIDTAIDLFPANITVHTLSIKNGSHFANIKPEIFERETIKMINYAYERLTGEGYKPYYLYRQKSMISNLENVGYARDNKICAFNVDSMEETCSILACGAGAISKRIFNLEHRIERLANVKNLTDYLNRINEILEKKEKFF